jgi:DNA polymerase V
MGDIARASEYNEDMLYRMFGVNAELLIDHAWGWEPCTMAAIKSYKPENHSLSQGQVLSRPYSFHEGKLIIREMTDQLSLDLVRKGLVADQIVLTVGYDHTGIPKNYNGITETDRYGKTIPKSAHGSINLGRQTASTAMFLQAVAELFDRIVDPQLMIRRMYVVANHVISEKDIREDEPIQYSFFDDIEEMEKRQAEEKEALAKEKQLQKALLTIKDKYGKNAILKGMNFEDSATARERNGTVGGHKA